MCFRTSQLVHLLFADTEPLSRTATRRPDLFVPSRHFSQQCRPPVEAFKSAPMDPLSWCAPPRVTPSCPTVFPRHTQLRMDMKTSLILARPLATALWPRPSSSTLVSWFISLPQEQSLYPGRPRGGLTIVPSRHLFQQMPTPCGGFKSDPTDPLSLVRPATASPRRAQPLRV